ncbi:ABC transporter ATP-binding protein, partial [bacterium]|nr:ABC transporter ATP-binding protein [bacterium]
YRNMTVLEFLSFIASIRGFNKQETQTRVNSIMETTSLTKAKYQTIDTLSKGYKQRVGFAQALIHDPPVLILDEPTDGLDPNQKREVRNLIKKISKEKAIILSTHILEEMEAVCTRAIIIDRGKIVANGSPDELLRLSSTYNVISMTMPEKPDDSIIQSLQNNEKVEKVKITESSNGNPIKIQIFPRDKVDILVEIKTFIIKEKLVADDIYREKGHMNEVFWNLTLGKQD